VIEGLSFVKMMIFMPICRQNVVFLSSGFESLGKKILVTARWENYKRSIGPYLDSDWLLKD
jgi:hypothetical protein